MGGIEFELKNRDPIDVSFNVSVRAGGGTVSLTDDIENALAAI